MTPEEKNELWRIKDILKDEIIEQLVNDTYKWSIPKKVEIAKGMTNKKRVVYMYSLQDRMVIGAIYRAVTMYHIELVSKNCFSYRKGISTCTAIEYIKKENDIKKYKYGVKLDIHAYFNSMSEKRVHELMDILFNNELGTTVSKIMLNNTVEYKGRIINEWKALVPGCAIGSLFANACLKPCDDYFIDKECIYARYSDDIIILSDSKEKLQTYLDKVLDFISSYGLTMNPDKYTWFEPGDSIEYLGLKLCKNGKIDISDHAKYKIKKQIHRWCRKGRMEMEIDHKPFELVARNIIRRLNYKNFKCYIEFDSTFGWCHYAFRYINTIQSLIEIDFYTRDTLRAMKTGRHNKNNVKALSDEDFKRLGWVSLVDLYKLYTEDFDYYCEIIELL